MQIVNSLRIIISYFRDVFSTIILGTKELYNLMFGRGLDQFVYYMTYGGGWYEFLKGFVRGLH